jgi:hydroxyethylthiazole kinase
LRSEIYNSTCYNFKVNLFKKGLHKMNAEAIINNLFKLREQKPLVHTISNIVVANITANGLLALGASPVMATAKEEVSEITRQADALVLNLGTLNLTKLDAMLIAGTTANQYGIPIVLDPVGVSASTFRKEAAKELLSSLNITVIRGNPAEVASLNNLDWESRGVDSIRTTGFDDVAIDTARRFNCTVAITGKEDIVTNGVDHYKIKNGHPLLTKVTGTGCLLSSIIGAFLQVHQQTNKAVASALSTYGVAAEIAAQHSRGRGPGTFQIELINSLANINEKQLLEYVDIEPIH